MSKAQKKAAKKLKQQKKLATPIAERKANNKASRPVPPKNIAGVRECRTGDPEQSVYERFASANGARPDKTLGNPFDAPNSEPLDVDVAKVYSFYHGTDRDVKRVITAPKMVTHPNGTAVHFGDNANDVRTFGQLIVKVEISGAELKDLGIRTRQDDIFADFIAGISSPINEYLFSEAAAKYILDNGNVTVALSYNFGDL